MNGQAGIYIHAGAHRTGTSSFQACLSLNRARLAAAGFDAAYPGRDGIIDGSLRLRLPNPRHRRSPDAAWVATLREELARHQSGPRRGLILSEENIPGRMFHFYQGQFYPAARRRIGVLAESLPGPVEHLLYVIRPYAALFTSAYRKRAEDNPVPDFSEIGEGMVGVDRGWPELLTILQRRLRPKRFTVIDYSARGSSCDLLTRLLPGDGVADLQEPEAQLNLSASDTALRALQARYRAGEKLERAEWQAVIADYAGADPGNRPEFAAFTPAQAAILAARYASDLARIRVMENIKFID
ncbi:hypothetical protein [Pseudooceanicola sp.]|uniref:hypothetical protein n=1 Tax=Pseudooceanicola sp. TaxID=1914328 RepID=UPI00261F2147|nr:hypothetical protein [Pseudooceanicola sp.]MDF1854149.1 hypothetical protein [Pseudooceanicola sp.]